MGLFFEGLGGEDEVLGDDGELVEDEVVRGRERGDEHWSRGVVEGVEEGLFVMTRRGIVVVGGAGWGDDGWRRGERGFGFGGEGGGEAELELEVRAQSLGAYL